MPKGSYKKMSKGMSKTSKGKKMGDGSCAPNMKHSKGSGKKY